MRGLSARLWRWGPVLAYAGLIFFLSSQSTFPVPAGVWNFDKLLHCLEYGGLSLLLCRALAGSNLSAVRVMVFSLLVSAAYGVSDEFHQSFVPGRDSSAYDALADLAGSSAAAVLRFAVHSLRRRST